MLTNMSDYFNGINSEESFRLVSMDSCAQSASSHLSTNEMFIPAMETASMETRFPSMDFSFGSPRSSFCFDSFLDNNMESRNPVEHVHSLTRNQSIILPSFSFGNPMEGSVGDYSYIPASAQLSFVPFDSFSKMDNTIPSSSQDFLKSEVVYTDCNNDIQLPTISTTDSLNDLASTDSSSDSFTPDSTMDSTVSSISTSTNVNQNQIKSNSIHPVESSIHIPTMDSEVSDTEWTDMNSSESTRKHVAWTEEECQLLREGVARFGSSGSWKEISKYVGTRGPSQCINKWKNDLCKNKRRWNKEATQKLISFFKKGYSEKEIFALMPEYTYIQLYQQIQKYKTNHQPWEDWEIQKLIALKKEGTLRDTEIGRKLNNRHKDDVKNMWNRLSKQH